MFVCARACVALSHLVLCGERLQVEAKVRLLGYLNPQSPLYFDARQQAVTISDYTLLMTRASSARDASAADVEEEEEEGVEDEE